MEVALFFLSVVHGTLTETEHSVAIVASQLVLLIALVNGPPRQLAKSFVWPWRARAAEIVAGEQLLLGSLAPPLKSAFRNFLGWLIV